MTGARIIAFSGTHGTGKTTSAKMAAEFMERKYPQKRIGLLIDIERQCPYPINQEGSARSQEWIFSHQLLAELDAMYHYDIVVTDRTLMDIAAYTQVLGYRNVADLMIDWWQYHSHRYKRIYYLNPSRNSHHVSDGVRDQCPNWRLKVDKVLRSLYSRIGVTFPQFREL